MIAYEALAKIRSRSRRQRGRAPISTPMSADLGYALLLKRYRRRCRRTPPPTQIAAGGLAAPCPMCRRCSGRSASWSASGFCFIAFFALRLLALDGAPARPLSLVPVGRRCSACRCPGSPSKLGWFVAEYGRQPWAIEGVLPTFLAVSGITPAQVLIQPYRLRHLLLRPAVVDALPDGEIHPARARRVHGGHGAETPPDAGRRAIPAATGGIGAAMISSTTKPCG